MALESDVLFTPDPGAGAPRVLFGDAARAEIDRRIGDYETQIADALAPYDPLCAIQAWHANIRAIEEFINAPMFAVGPVLLAFRLDSLPGRPEALCRLATILRSALDEAVVIRIVEMASKLAVYGSFLVAKGITLAGGMHLETYGEAVEYLQSRRRHFVSMLYLMPAACRGLEPFDEVDGISILAPLVDEIAVYLSNLHQQRAQLEIRPDYTLTVAGPLAVGSHAFSPLEDFFLEPERVSIVAMGEQRAGQITPLKLERVNPRKLFSSGELRNHIRCIDAAYAAFGLQDSDFDLMARLIMVLSLDARDDYYLHLPVAVLDTLIASQAQISADRLRKLLVHRPGTYIACTNGFEPFVLVGEHVTTNVGLLARFLYAFKNVHLASRRKFVVHAGFIFEDVVKQDLRDLGYTIADFKRINHQEFDVVAERDGKVFNIQCKNNAVDLARIDTDPQLFARYNRRLVGYYRRALIKERRREKLLLDRLGVASIRHVVISRFPVVTDDPDILCYNQLSDVFA